MLRRELEPETSSSVAYDKVPTSPPQEQPSLELPPGMSPRGSSAYVVAAPDESFFERLRKRAGLLIGLLVFQSCSNG